MIIAVSALAWVTAIGTTIAAVAGAVAAIAAWRSAGASLETGRDAREALALGIVPSVLVRTIFEDNKAPPDGLMPFDYFLEVTNGLSPDATDVVVEIRYRDATVDVQRRESLPQPLTTNSRGPVEPPWKLAIKGVKPLGSGPYGDLLDRVESIVVSYSDMRDIGVSSSFGGEGRAALAV